jgi:predicted dehydrogenase
MLRRRLAPVLIVFLAAHMSGADSMTQARLIVLDPGHFHAALVQKEMYPWLSPQVSVYAPLGPEVLDYLQRVALYNKRTQGPTSWQIDLHTGPDFLERMLRERPGNVLILTGRNRPKMDRIRAGVAAGLNVLADKPWIISSAELPNLERALEEAGRNGLMAYDIMTERYEITSILLRELVNDREVFGTLVSGSESAPAVTAKSVHYLMKVVSGVPLRRPAWFFDVAETGEGLADVGTHVVDLVQWIAFPDQELNYRSDVRISHGRHWPTVISQADFERVTGESTFPTFLAGRVKDGKLDYYCNNAVDYTLRGIHVRLEILWDWQATEAPGDTFETAFHGSKARVEIRQGKTESYVPEIYVVPNSGAVKAEVLAALKRRLTALEATYPGVGMRENADSVRLAIPDRFRVGHEAHFAQVTNRFFEYLKTPRTIPAWEKANMLVKYFITTMGVEAAR